MIISASRRTDIPAFYTEWFMNRIRSGYCTVPNPFNTNQVSWVDLSPENIDVIVFWTRNPHPLLPYLSELDKLGYRYYFQYTVMANPQEIDPKSPPTNAAINTFKALSTRIGAERVIWRYDPIVFTPLTQPDYHLSAFAQICRALNGCTRRVVISLVDVYPKAKKRMADMAGQGAPLQLPASLGSADLQAMLRGLASLADENGMEITSCSEEINLTPFSIQPGKCVDDQYIQKVFGIEASHKKDPSQRESCGCVVSKDIGMYDTCLFGCQYCYATSSFERARKNHTGHDPASPSLIGWYDCEKPAEKLAGKKKNIEQLRMWDE